MEWHIHFLVECATDFTRAILQRNRADLMQAGKSFSVDYCFKSMIAIFPLYLKRHILSFQGTFVRNTFAKNGSMKSSQGAPQSSSHHSSTSSGSVELDAAVEESIGKQLITESKTRLAVQSALSGKSAYSMKALMIYNVWQVIVSLAVAAFGFFAFFSYFDGRSALIARGGHVTKTRVNLAGFALAMLLNFGNQTGHLDLSTVPSFYRMENEDDLFITSQKPFSLQATLFTAAAQNSWNAFETAVTSLAQENTEDIYELFPSMFMETVPTIQCYKAHRMPVTMMNLKSIFSYAYMVAQVLTATDATDWYTSANNFCSFFSAFTMTSDGMAAIRASDRMTASLVAEDDL
jgi:hypothetical protein